MKIELIDKTLSDYFTTLKQFKKKSFQKNLLKVAKEINLNINSQNKILVCGNGGSAAQASHFSTELVVRFKKEYERKPYNSLVLASDMTLLTAIGNDYGFEKIFSRQIEGLGKKNDILILFSTSGKSKNLIKASEQASKMNIKTISLTGNDGGTLKKKTKFNINIKSKDTARIQECHLYIIHLLIELIEIENHK
tara:strand:- start:8356 stop:8937 length:582 start_codon:yes stop_codon:yes gene_type:complete